MDDDASDYGPVMRSLSPRKRAFVLAMAADPLGDQQDWAIAAGYSDASGRAKVTASELAHDPVIQAASDEVARAHLYTFGPTLAVAGLLRIARDPKHPKYLRALETILNRVGVSETTEHRVSVTHTDRTGEAMLERIKRLAADMGLPVEQVLGVNSGPKMIEGEVINARRLDEPRGD